ncbi:transcription initiation factor IIA subunit 1-like isoform X1 [Asterias rubens]|uniref:transcription initiation factor IIA subunit 1-like isoform X1 n=1 Tax=Asterias rubens TaxID=7604 RepID=UPI001455052F|nr:transcription initiation factor IIA subunit 1-like isoform X1 [Asterias rubens]
MRTKFSITKKSCNRTISQINKKHFIISHLFQYKLYKSVIDDVILNVREAFLDEGVDEQVLQELKQIWMNKLILTRAVDPTPQPLPQAESSRQSRGHHSRSNASSSASHMQAQMQLQAVADAQQRQTAAASRAAATQQQGNQPFQITGAATQQLSSSAAAAALAFQQGVLQLQHPLTTLPAGLTLAQPAVTQTFPAYTLSQPQGGLQPSYQAVLPSGQTVMIQPPPQVPQSQQSQQAGGAQPTINITTVQARVLQQVDGANDTSDEDDDDDDDDDEDNENDDDENEDNNDYSQDIEEKPLNSDDDVSDEDPAELFETENVVVCQYDKISRSRNRWKFHLKNGIMNVKGRDYIFFKAGGDADW